MARGSPLCGQLREKIVEQFKNNVPQRTIARNLGISSSTVHNIIKRFRESGEITTCKRQGRKPTLNARDLRSLRRHCIKNRHQCVKDITTWAQELFRKPLSVNTVRRYIRKCNLKLYYAKQKPSSTTPRNAVDFSGPELIWDGLMPSGKVFCGLTSRHFKLFLENVDVVSSGPKRKRTIRTVMDAKFKSQHLWWYGAVLVPVAWGTCTSVKAPLMLKGTYRFWSNTCCHPSNVFFMDAPAYFSKTMPNHILHVWQQRGFEVKECGY